VVSAQAGSDPPREPVRIAFILHVMQVAGAEVLVAEIIRRLGARIAPTVICLDGVGQLGERMRAEGVTVVSLDRRPGLDLGVARRMAHELRTRRIQVVHAHQYTPFFYAALGSWLVRPRPLMIFTEHGRHYPDVVSAKRRLVNRLLLARRADVINAVCAFSARALADLDGFDRRPIAVIENGIDIPVDAPQPPLTERRAALGLPATRRHVICVARFHPVKDHEMLLRAFARVAGQVPDVDLLLAGDGPLRPQLEAQIASLGIGGRVRLLGVRRDVPQLLAASDVFTLTSVSEAASLTLLEAMAARRPVVVTDVGGNPEIVRQGIEGRLVPRGDADATAAALVSLLADPQRAVAMGEAGYQRVVERYQLADTVRRYDEIYARAASADSKAR
jgi:glycosyltransferase involved in cell wall biosynthesis